MAYSVAVMTVLTRHRDCRKRCVVRAQRFRENREATSSKVSYRPREARPAPVAHEPDRSLIKYFRANRARLYAKGPANFGELEDLNPSLSGLDLPHKRIGSVEPGGKLPLGKPGRLPSLDDGRDQGPMARASEVLQASAPKMEAILLTARRLAPVLVAALE